MPLTTVPELPDAIPREGFLLEASNLYPQTLIEKIGTQQQRQHEINELMVQSSYYGENPEFDAHLKRLGLNLIYDTSKSDKAKNFAKNGFRGQIYQDSEGNLYAGIRGTAFSSLDTLSSNSTTDTQIALAGSFNTAYQDCLFDFAETIKEKITHSDQQISLHGHSLGGAGANFMATMMGMVTPNKIIAFCSDPIGVPASTDYLIAAYQATSSTPGAPVSMEALSTAYQSIREKASITTHLGEAEQKKAHTTRMDFLNNTLNTPDSPTRVKLYNMAFAVRYPGRDGRPFLQFSPVSTISPQFGDVIVLAVTEPQFTPSLSRALKSGSKPSQRQLLECIDARKRCQPSHAIHT